MAEDNLIGLMKMFPLGRMSAPAGKKCMIDQKIEYQYSKVRHVNSKRSDKLNQYLQGKKSADFLKLYVQ